MPKQPDPTNLAGPPFWGVKDLPDERTLDQLLDKAKGRLFFKKGAGFLGSLLCGHNFVWDKNCQTAWCNGETIGFNPWFFAALDKEGRVTLLAHELWHTGFDHLRRVYDRDGTFWNYAADYVINNMLDDHGFSFESLKAIGANGLLDHQYDRMSTEEVYEIIFNDPPPMCSAPAQDCPEEGDPGDKDGEGGSSDNGDENVPALSGDIRPIPKGKEQEITGKLVQAVQASKRAKEAGVIPGELEEVLENFLNPVLPWETLLYRFFNEMNQDDYSWKRPSRRHEDVYLPSLMGENGLEHLVYYLDVSGSITEEQALRFFSEVKFIHETLTPRRLTMKTFDTKIQDVYELEEGDPFQKFTIHGRGGTSLEVVEKDIRKERPTAAVIFSDMYVHPMRKDPGSPILWAVMDNKKAKVPFGTVVHIPKSAI